MTRRLSEMGIRCAREPESTFYAWAGIADLPAPFDDVRMFFRRALEREVTTVPGAFFDVNPGKSRVGASPFER